MPGQAGGGYWMASEDVQERLTNKDLALTTGWYDALFVRSVERPCDNVACSFLEFKIEANNKSVWAILHHNEESSAEMDRLKAALGMSERDIDFKPHCNSRLKIFIENSVSEGGTVNEVKDFAAKPDQRKTNQSGSGNQPPRQILIVDDQPEVAALIGNYVKQIGFTPVVVSGVEQAIARFEPELFFMIISDVIMPGQNGFDLVRHMHNKHPRVSVALMSGYFDKEMENLQQVFGIEKIYRKPVFFNSVKEMVATSLKKMAADSIK